MSDTKIAAELRTEFGKGAARRLRRTHHVPAVLYGHGTDPIHLSLPGHETWLVLKQGVNVLITLDFEGGSELALPKHVQRDPLKGTIEHVDLLLVKRGEKVTVDVPIILTGDAAPGTLVNVENTSIAVEAEATHLPESIEVSIEGLEEGTQVLAKDLVLPSGSTLAADEELLVVNINAAPTAEQMEGDAAEDEETVTAVGEPGAAAEGADGNAEES